MARKAKAAKKTAKRKPPTTQMVGEDVFTTLALGEEGPHFTTLIAGEEHPTTLGAPFEEHPKTFAIGEEVPTDLRSENQQPTTLGHPFEELPTDLRSEQQPTTLGHPTEEGPTTLALGEEGPPSIPVAEDLAKASAPKPKRKSAAKAKTAAKRKSRR